jgi:hypothetical protein
MRMRRVAAVALIAAMTAACGSGGLFRQYEYEEDYYLSLDGTATVYVNSSVAALVALRGAPFDAALNARTDRAALIAWYSSPVTHDVKATTSRRRGRVFVHVRLTADDVNRLSEAAPFSWATYRFGRDGDSYVYRQAIGPSADAEAGGDAWTGRELVAFRLHLPSKIRSHDAAGTFKRGNILAWEQPLADRLRGQPLTLTAQMETQSILYRTLWLFAVTLGLVAVTFALAIVWIVRRGARPKSTEMSHDHV